MIIKFKNKQLAEQAYEQANKLSYNCVLRECDIHFNDVDAYEDFLSDIDINAYGLPNKIDEGVKLNESSINWKKLSGIQTDTQLKKGVPSIHDLKAIVERSICEDIEENFVNDLSRKITTPNEVYKQARIDMKEFMSQGLSEGLAIAKSANQHGLYPRDLQNWMMANGLVEGANNGFDDLIRHVIKITDSAHAMHPGSNKEQVLETVLNNPRLKGAVTANNVEKWLRETRNIDFSVWFKA